MFNVLHGSFFIINVDWDLSLCIYMTEWYLYYRVVISDKLTTFILKIPENLTVISRHLDVRPALSCSVYLVLNVSAHLSMFWTLSTLSSTASTILRYNYLFGILCVLSVPAPGKKFTSQHDNPFRKPKHIFKKKLYNTPQVEIIYCTFIITLIDPGTWSSNK